MNDNTQYKVIAHKEDEVMYTDGAFLSKCSILIFKKENKSIKNLLRSMDAMKIKTIDECKDEKELKELIESISVGLMEKAKVDKEIEDELRTFVYTSDMTHPNIFKIFQKIGANTFKANPEISEGIPKTIELNNSEDMKNLIQDGYEVIAFTNMKQYQKVLADYFIENKEMYGIDKTAEEIYNEMIHTPKVEKDELFSNELLGLERDALEGLDIAGKELLEKGNVS